VHAVVDMIEIMSEVLHILGRITAVSKIRRRRRWLPRSLAAIAYAPAGPWNRARARHKCSPFRGHSRTPSRRLGSRIPLFNADAI
jgi:hypothetical protein